GPEATAVAPADGPQVLDASAAAPDGLRLDTSTLIVRCSPGVPGFFSVYRSTRASSSTTIVPRVPITHSPYFSKLFVLIDEYVTPTMSCLSFTTGAPLRRTIAPLLSRS